MKTSILMLLACLALAGCQKKSDYLLGPQTQPRAQADEEFQKAVNIDQTLDEIARYLAQHEQLLTGAFAGKMKNVPVSLSDLNLNHQFTSKFQNDEGRAYEIMVELSTASALNHSEAVRVALDPDHFYAEESTFPAYVLDQAQNQVKVEQIAKSRAANRALSFPLVLVTLQDRTELSLAEVQKGSIIFHELRNQSSTANQIAPAYLAVTKIRLLTYKDDFSFEEFELYVREGAGASAYYHPTTIHKFDGTNRRDAAGRLVYYPDVNVIGTIYVMPQPIALWPLSDQTPISISPLEDDCIAGEHRNWDYPSPYVKGLNEYHRPSDAVRFNIPQRFNLTGVGCSFGNDDDTYDNGTLSEWTISNTPVDEISITMADMQIWLKKIVMFAPVEKNPPAE